MTCGHPDDPTILHQSHHRGAAFTSSFAEEADAMQLEKHDQIRTSSPLLQFLTLLTSSHFNVVEKKSLMVK